MKSFKFDTLDKKLNRKTQQQLNQQKMRQNFLRLYDDIPPDPKMESYIAQTRQQFDEHCKNNRNFSYELPEKGKQAKSKALESSVREIRRMGNFVMPFRGEPDKIEEQSVEAKQQRKRKQREHKKNLHKKFRMTIKLILHKMRRMGITMSDIITKKIFTREPYHFGSQIFSAVKQGNAEKVWSILMQKRLAMFSVDNTGKNGLIWSCIRGFPRITRIIAEFGADVNYRDINKTSALDYAIKYNNAECIKILMLFLANIEQQNGEMIKSAEEKVRNVFNLGVSLVRVMRKIEYGKREELFDQQYRIQYKERL